MSDPQRVADPAKAFENLQKAMGQILTVSKKEIVRREDEAKEQRKRERKKAA